jgi:hypothetical protein
MGVELTSLTTQQRLDLGSCLGIIKIASGRISSPVEYFDVALPSGYETFLFHFNDLLCAGNKEPAAVLSTDSGVTFWNDAVNFDTYSRTLLGKTGNGATDVADGIAAVIYVEADDAVIDTGWSTGNNEGVWRISPGTASLPPRIAYQQTSYKWTDGQDWGQLGSVSGIVSLNPKATIAPVLARCNLIRFAPGDADFNPPTTGFQFTSGVWTLFGIPTP